MRSVILIWQELLNDPVSAATLAFEARFRAVFPSNCRLSGSPLGKVSLFRVGPGSFDVIPGIASETLTRARRAENLPGGSELAHLNQVAANSVLLLDDVLSTGTTASEGAWVLRKAEAKPVSVRSVARKLKNHAIEFEAEPEGNA